MDAKNQLDDVCIVCCRKISVYAVGVCDHPVCYECSTRLRVICRQNECPICRRDIPKVIFTHKLRPFSLLSENAYSVDKKYKIWFENEEVHEMFQKLLEHNCQICSSKPSFPSFGHLKEHVRREHERFYCDLCVNNLMIFTFERKSYSRKELAVHRRTGDLDDTSHRGHPLCLYCDDRYVDNDELFRHLRREHYFCHFCDIDNDEPNRFYSNYAFLRSHFRAEHYLCEEGACRDEKFTAAFRSEIDLKAHRAMHHSKNLSKAEAKQARTLELEFTIAPRKHQNGNTISTFPPEDSNYRRGRRDYRRGKNQSHKDRDCRATQSNTMQQSCDVMQQPKTNSFEDNINMQSEKDFPHLTSTTTLSSTTNSNAFTVDGNTLANRIARNNRFTIRTSESSHMANVSKINDEEFPSLGSAVIKLPTHVGSQSSQVTVTSCPQSGTSNRTRNTLMFHFNSNEECSSSSRHPHNVSIQVSRSPNTVVHKNVTDNSTKKISTCQNIHLSHPNSSFFNSNNARQYTAKEDFTDLKMSEKTLKSRNFDEEFPELDVLKQFPNNSSSVVIPLSQTSIGVVGTRDSPPYITVKCKSKKKKQKSVAIEPETKESNLNNEPNKKKKKEPYIMQNIGAQSDELKTSLENRENEDPLKELSSLGKASVSKQQEINSEYDITEDLSQQTMNLVMDDFPPLPSIKISHKAPPGFVSSESVSTTFPPPGFTSDKNCDVQQTAPTVNISLSTVAKQLTSSLATHSSSNINNNNKQDITNILTHQVPKYTYTQPSNFQQRNRELIQQILNFVDGDNDRFNYFKTLSGHFRQSIITANNYYEKCLDILGRDKLFQVLPELLVLLPDINKQQELLDVHNNFYQRQAEIGGAVPKNKTWNGSSQSMQFLVCATCQQVLINKDFRNHMLQHKDNGFCNFQEDTTSDAEHITWVKK